MSARLTTRFEKLKAEKRAGLITFTMAYDPDRETSLNILKALPAAGADIMEVGIPFSDPMADGPTIQAAGLRALEAGATLKGILSLVADFRKSDNETPIVLMGYFNPLFIYGVDKFAKDAVAAGVDGLIIVDLPPEEAQELLPATNAAGLDFVRLLTPTTDDVRLPKVMQGATGFAYYVSVAGITGAKSADIKELKARANHLKNKINIPLAVGFGVKTPEQVQAISAFADAVVVGSALVNVIAESAPAQAAEKASAFIANLLAERKAA